MQPANSFLPVRAVRALTTDRAASQSKALIGVDWAVTVNPALQVQLVMAVEDGGLAVLSGQARH